MDSVRTLLVLHLYYSHQDSPSSAFILSSAILVAQVSVYFSLARSLLLTIGSCSRLVWYASS